MPSWPDIPKEQIISYKELEQAISEGYLKAKNKFPAGLNMSEMVSKINFEYYCDNPVEAGVANEQLVNKGAIVL